jgi:hypothetical protein
MRTFLGLSGIMPFSTFSYCLLTALATMEVLSLINWVLGDEK